MNHNLYAALRAAFPKDLNATAVETDEGLFYSWSDLERASAMMANLLDSLRVPKGARVAKVKVRFPPHFREVPYEAKGFMKRRGLKRAG